jgi:hypothetical protein
MSAIRVFAVLLVLASMAPDASAISRDPNGVNVNSQGATSVFITFGGLDGQVPVEATWCGELVPAAPDLGFRCDPSTIFGRLPIRFDQSRLSGDGRVFTDIMSIPPSVARRAYQAASRGETSSFFYVRRFVSTSGGPDEYVFVTCRLTGGGARVPLALLDVRLGFAADTTVLAVPAGAPPPPLSAEITYNGSGRLRGRWEVVQPGDDPPTSTDLLTEATLPPDERPLQRRYTLVERFDVFLPPIGRAVVQGPDPERLPTEIEGLYQILLRVEASADKEGDSNLAAADAGSGIIHAGAVAGFPMPTLRYFVGSATEAAALAGAGRGLALLVPVQGRQVPGSLTFAWNPIDNVLAYRLEIERSDNGEPVLQAVVQQGIASYAAPPWLAERAGGGELRWRVVALGPGGGPVEESPWRSMVFESAPEE